jgi:hypothetical protein
MVIISLSHCQRRRKFYGTAFGKSAEVLKLRHPWTFMRTLEVGNAAKPGLIHVFFVTSQGLAVFSRDGLA